MDIYEQEVGQLASAIEAAFTRCPGDLFGAYRGETWFEAELAAARDPRARLRAWAALAYKASSELARKRCPRAAWRLARLAQVAAEHLLPEEIEPRHRTACGMIAIGALAMTGEAAAALGHPLGKAVAVARMIARHDALGAGDPLQMALTVENVLPDLVERGRIIAAQGLLESVPDGVANAHPDWAAVRAKVEAALKRPWSERTTRAEVLAALRCDVMRLLAVDDVELRQIANDYLARLEAQFDPALILELGKILQTKAVTLGDNDLDASLRIEAMDLLREALDGIGNEASWELARLCEIESQFVRRGAWDDVATTRLAIGRAFDYAGNVGDAIEWFMSAVDAQARLGLDPDIPALTAGIAESLRPYYEHLIDALIDAGRARDALLVAEHCKGELWRRVRGTPRPHITDLFATTRDLTGFVSWFVAEAGVTILWGDPTGEVHATRMGIARNRLEEVVGHLRPNGWRPVGLFPPSNLQALKTLSRLVEPLRPLFTTWPDSGKSLTFSPDGILHNVPWHLLTLDDVALIARAPIRTVLSLDHAEFAGAAEPSVVGATVIVVPAQGEHDAPAWAAWASELARLLGQGDGTLAVAANEGGTRDVLTTALDEAFVHVRCHGHFPEREQATAVAAYRQSGLLLAEGERPLRTAGAAFTSPALLLDARSPSVRPLAHVALEACVSGAVRDGAAGDPIGLPWGLALLGARTIVASHWNVETAHAQAFFMRYYEALLGARTSPAEAHRSATLDVLSRFGPAAAAFRLLGDG